MTLTDHSKPVTSANGVPGALTAPRLAPPRTRRRPAFVALGIALVAAGALVAVWLVNTAGQRVPVLVAARDIPFGTTLTQSDLATVDVSVDPSVAVISAGEVDSLVGMTASTTIMQGSLLSRSEVSAAGPPAAGQVLVGVAVPAARMPAGGLTAGDRVLVVTTPAADADPPSGPPDSVAATVVRVGAADLNGVTVVDVTTAAGDGPALAARAATGRIAIVLEPRVG